MDQTEVAVAPAWTDAGAVLLVSGYELGHQPLGLASPLGSLRELGFESALCRPVG